MSSKLSKTRWKKIDSIFDVILQLPPEQQLEQLKQQCDTNQSLVVEIQSLLDAQKNSPELLEGRAFDLLSTISIDNEFLKQKGDPQSNNRQNENFIGRNIGAYRIYKEIGRGGMGLVFLAKRADNTFEQTVAIKILHTKEHHQEMNSRFQREQQVLASLNHPNIAQLYDGGVTEEGIHYFIMEYVKGERIDKYCDRLELNINSRLQLVLQIINALSAAHNNFIIHRDIKPSNILVTDDGKIKLLDFGIAKLLSDSIDMEQTQTKGLIMTFGYAAPEQLLNKPVTVETDIYQLGLVMYKLLTGIQAYQNETGSLIELTRKVCEKEPQSPSSIIKNYSHYVTEKKLPSAIIDICKSRQTNEYRLQQILEGDIDAIILKALAVDISSRYHSMGALKLDIERYFLNLPIAARKATFFYQAKKFLRRHWQISASLSVIFLLVLSYAITVTLQTKELKLALEKAELEKEKSQHVSNFMINIFKAADPNISGLEDVTASTLLKRGHQKILSDLNNTPEVQGLLLTNLGEIHYTLGEFDQGVLLLEEALSKQREVTPVDLLATANTLTKLGIAYTNTSQLDSAISLLEEALKIYENLQHEGYSTKSLEFSETNVAYAELLRRLGRMTEAESYFNLAILNLRKIKNNESTELATALNGLAAVQFIQGFLVKSKTNMLEAINLFKEVSGENNSYYTVLLNNYSLLLIKMEKFDEAFIYANKSLEIQKIILRKDHPYLAETQRSLGKILHYKGELHKAKDNFIKALAINRSNISKDNFQTAALHHRLGAVLQDLGEYSAAKESFDQMMVIYSGSESGQQNIARGTIRLASLSYTSGDLEKARSLYQKALELLPKTGLRASEAQVGYAQILLKLNEIEKAKINAQLALKTRAKKLSNSHSLVAEAKATLGLALIKEESTADKGMEYLNSAEQVLRHHKIYQFGHHKLLMQSIAKHLSK